MEGIIQRREEHSIRGACAIWCDHMVVPIIAGLAVLTLVGTGRAAFRAFRRYQAIPPEIFAAIRNNDLRDGSQYASTNFLPGGFQESMTYNEALQILELHPGATRAEVLQRHRQVMLSNHPDHGGTNYFATKINEARDILLGRSK